MNAFKKGYSDGIRDTWDPLYYEGLSENDKAAYNHGFSEGFVDWKKAMR